MGENGKGDVPRPMVVGREAFASNWERTFAGGTGEAVVDSESLSLSVRTDALAQSGAEDGRDPDVVCGDDEGGSAGTAG